MRGAASDVAASVRSAGRKISKSAPAKKVPTQMDAMMKGASFVMSSGKRMSLAEKGLPLGRVVAGRDHAIGWLPGMVGGWTQQRDIPEPPKQSFRNWWKKHEGETEQRLAQDGVVAFASSEESADGPATTRRTEQDDAVPAIPPENSAKQPTAEPDQLGNGTNDQDGAQR